jgi:ABC-2 type transport system permease protein
MIGATGWMRQTFTLELRKALTYRVDFWVNFVVQTAVELGIAYFLWGAIFAAKGVDQIGGYTFRAMMIYYFLVPVVSRVLRATEGPVVANDIYEGSLNRYLVYPVSFFGYKYMGYLAQALISIAQLSLALVAFLWIFGIPGELSMSLGSVIQGLASALFAGTLYFTLVVLLDLSAFWMENIWSLQVMLRSALQFLGGAMIPLSLMPQTLQKVLAFLPFQYLVSFPVRTMMGRVTQDEWFFGMGMIGAWLFVGATIVAMIWRSGLRRYTGVGM